MNYRVTNIVEITNKLNYRKNKKSTNLWVGISFIQFGIIFAVKNFIRILPIPLKFKYKTDLKYLAKKNNINYIVSHQINNVLDELKNTDLVISCFQPKIIKNPHKYKFKIINCHPGCLKNYRGNSPVFWAMFDNQPFINISIHFVKEGIDTGEIINSKSIKCGISLGDNYFNVYKLSPLIIAESLKKVFKHEKNILEPYKKGIYRITPSEKDKLLFFKKGKISRLKFSNFFELIRTF